MQRLLLHFCGIGANTPQISASDNIPCIRDAKQAHLEPKSCWWYSEQLEFVVFELCYKGEIVVDATRFDPNLCNFGIENLTQTTSNPKFPLDTGCN